MHPDVRQLEVRRPELARHGLFRWIILAFSTLALAGCEEEPRSVSRKPAASSPTKQESGSILGRRTQKVIAAEPELETGKAKVASTKITAKDPILLIGNAYVATVGRSAVLAIEAAVNLFHANNDRYPKDLDEFMSEIIKANGIALPVLPDYQEYAYDAKEHKLIILEYPDRK
jgi:hypothetical protein